MDFLNILKWNVSGAHDSEVRSAARAKAGSSRMRVPKEIQKLKIAMTTDCVLACHHCKVDKKAAQCITFDDAAKAVDLLMSSPGKEKRLEFYGGEPFLKFQLLRSIVEYAKTSSILSGKQLSISVASNGLVLNEERLDFLKRNRINLSISVSGSEKAHDINRVYPGGKGSYADLMKKLGLVFNRMAAEDVVALECVQPSCASLLGRDLRRLAARGFKVMNIECVHGPVWGRDSLEDLENGLRSFAKWLFDEIRRGKYIALEPFLEFFRVKGAGGSIDCPLYRDLELYPDGVLSFYPFAFIDYPKWRKTVKIGSAASGLFKRYSSCAPGGKLCSDCVKEYYVIGGLSSGAQAYRLRTEMLKKIFLEIMRRSREEKAFKDYARWLAGLKQRTYIDYRGAK